METKKKVYVRYYLIVYVFIFQVLHDVHIEPAHIMKKRSVNQSLRILLYYDESVYR